MKLCLVLVTFAVAPVAAFGSDIPPDLETLATNQHLDGTDPHWILDPVSGCYVFDGFPSPRETATWVGGCVDKMATGIGTATLYLDGEAAETRTGMFVRGSLNGHGTATMSDGSTYDGDWAYGARFGFGTLKRANGNIYKGAWPRAGTYTRRDGYACAAESRRDGGSAPVYAPAIIDVASQLENLKSVSTERSGSPPRSVST